MREIDFRSDTKTKPTPEMRQAIAEAKVGDDVAGEDPTVNRLEQMAAEMLGKEAAVLVTSGTQGNLASVLAHCQRGDEVILGKSSHIYLAEAGGVSALGGVAFQPLEFDQRGLYDLDELDRSVHADNDHYAPTRLIALENTNNATGGLAQTPEETKSMVDVARRHDVAVHLDGARLFNAAVYLETPVSELVKDVDTVTFCLSKGLGCPVGSVVCGSAEDIEKVRRWRKMLGAGMRQAGIIAAAGVVALETMIERLAEDHSNARKLLKGLSGIDGIEVDIERFETNLVFCDVTASNSSELSRLLTDQGVLVNERGYEIWRFVTHHPISPDDIDYTVDVIKETFARHAVLD